MTKIINVGSRKGGAGKTTLTVNLGYGLAKLGKKVLILDCDPQANASLYLGLWAQANDGINIDKAFLNPSAKVSECVVSTEYSNLDMAPTYLRSLAGISREISYDLDCNHRLASWVKFNNKDLAKYDYIFIDTSPASDVFTTNAMIASDYVVATGFVEPYGWTGIDQLRIEVDKINNISPTRIIGVVLNGLESRKMKDIWKIWEKIDVSDKLDPKGSVDFLREIKEIVVNATPDNLKGLKLNKNTRYDCMLGFIRKTAAIPGSIKAHTPMEIYSSDKVANDFASTAKRLQLLLNRLDDISRGSDGIASNRINSNIASIL